MFNSTLTRPARRLLWSANVRKGYVLHRTRARAAWLLFALMLLGLEMLLTGCATPPAQSSSTPTLPSKPALSQPQPSEPYSVRVLRNIKAWEKSLTDSITTGAP